jgi:integrase
MATFRKRSDKWQARVQRQGYPDQCKTFFMRSDAEAWARKTEIELDQGILNSKANPNTLLKELLVRYKCEVTSKKKFASVEEYRVTAWQKHPLANYAISKIKSSDIAQWRDEKIKLKKAPNTIRLDLAVLSHLFTVARNEWGFEGLSNPATHITLPKLPSGRTRRLLNGELDLILQNTDSALLKPIVLLAVETAMRRSEITSLEWKNLNLNKKTILIPVTKNGEAREVPLSEIALTQILQMNRTQARIFNITSHAITIAFGRACKRSGINDLPFHSLRHEAISRFFEKGFSIAEVALISGHKTWSMLRRYTHLKAEDLAKKMEQGNI